MIEGALQDSETLVYIRFTSYQGGGAVVAQYLIFYIRVSTHTLKIYTTCIIQRS